MQKKDYESFKITLDNILNEKETKLAYTIYSDVNTDLWTEKTN